MWPAGDGKDVNPTLPEKAELTPLPRTAPPTRLRPEESKPVCRVTQGY